MNPTSVSGDPRLDYDRARGSVIVDDGPGPEWSVTIRLDTVADRR